MAIRICFGYLDLCTHSALYNIFFQQQKMILSSPMQIPSFLYLNISPRNSESGSFEIFSPISSLYLVAHPRTARLAGRGRVIYFLWAKLTGVPNERYF